MNFSYGVIAAVGVLVAVSIGFIVMEPDYIIADNIPPEPVVVDVVDVSAENATMADETPSVVLIPVGTSVPGCEADDSCYLPGMMTVAPGTTVTWVVEDTAAHTVTSGSPTSGIGGDIDSGLLAPGAEFEHTFDQSGTYEYFCVVHPWMVGAITVS